MVKFYLYHGTDREGFEGIGDGDVNCGGLVKKAYIKVTPGNWSGLGLGIYGSTYYSKAREYGDYIYLFEFDGIEKIKVSYNWDNVSAWRAHGCADDAYMPAYEVGGAANLDEFCFRGSKLSKAYLVRYPNGYQVYNYHFKKPKGLRETMEEVCSSYDDNFWMTNLNWQGGWLGHDVTFNVWD